MVLARVHIRGRGGFMPGPLQTITVQLYPHCATEQEARVSTSKKCTS